MRIRKAVAVAILCAIALASFVSITNAQVRNPTGTASSVSKAWAGVNIADVSGVVTVGSTVYIYWEGVQPPSTGTVYVTVYKPDGSMLGSWGPFTPSQSGIPSFVASLPGNYYIVLDGYPSYHLFTTFVAGISVFVLPESVFGTLAAIGAGFAAFGTVKVYRKRKKD